MRESKELKELWDCHAHLYAPEFDDKEIDDILHQSHGNDQVQLTVVVVPETLEQSKLILESCEKYNNRLQPCVGIHPETVVRDYTHNNPAKSLESDLHSIRELIITDQANCRNRVVGVGEIGLDYSPHLLPPKEEEAEYNNSKQLQQYAFEYQLKLANEYELAVNVHSRNAGHYCIETIRRMNCQRVLMHAFDGSKKYVSQAVQAGFYFSVPPSILRPNSTMSKWIRLVPLDRMLLESDSPALAPKAGERSNPWNCLKTAEFLSQLLGHSRDEILHQTTRNAKALFNV